MPKIYICSPYRGDITHNTNEARRYCRAAIELGYQPIAPHLYYTQFLDDDDREERAMGLQFGLQDLDGCDELWAFPPERGISEGMRGEIDRALRLNIPVKWFSFGISDIDLRTLCRAVMA